MTDNAQQGFDSPQNDKSPQTGQIPVQPYSEKTDLSAQSYYTQQASSPAGPQTSPAGAQPQMGMPPNPAGQPTPTQNSYNQPTQPTPTGQQTAWPNQNYYGQQVPQPANPQMRPAGTQPQMGMPPNPAGQPTPTQNSYNQAGYQYMPTQAGQPNFKNQKVGAFFDKLKNPKIGIPIAVAVVLVIGLFVYLGSQGGGTYTPDKVANALKSIQDDQCTIDLKTGPEVKSTAARYFIPGSIPRELSEMASSKIEKVFEPIDGIARCGKYEAIIFKPGYDAHENFPNIRNPKKLIDEILGDTPGALKSLVGNIAVDETIFKEEDTPAGNHYYAIKTCVVGNCFYHAVFEYGNVVFMDSISDISSRQEEQLILFKNQVDKLQKELDR